MEIKSHSWKLDSENYHAAFFPFIKGKPRYDLNCSFCEYYINDETDCEKAQEIGTDDKLYPFCGPICGYFKLQEELE